MIYLYHGTDIKKIITKSHDLVISLQKKKPDASYFKLNSENFNIGNLDEYIGGQGLFVNKYIVVLDRLCENKEIKDEFISKIKEIAESENIFIIIEGKLDKATLSKIEKKAEKVVEFNLEEKDKIKKDTNIFAIADALARKDKKTAWVMYREAIDRGEAVEALHGMVFWKIKTLILSGGNGVWNKAELLKVLDELITIYHESRRGKYELESKFEGFILGI